MNKTLTGRGLAALLLLSLLSSCGKDFLELVPQSEVNAANFYKTEADIRAAVNGAYGSMQSTSQYFGNFVYLLENRSDNIYDTNPGGNAGREYSLDFFIETTDNGVIQGSWSSLYNGILQCNTVLDKIDAVPMNATAKEQLKAEMRFIRALNYFHLVRMWGKVPLIIKALSPAETYSLGRNEVAEVYNAIEQDLTFAGATLPATYPVAQNGKATSGAALGLLGKVYLTQQKFLQAKNTLAQVIATNRYQLLPNVADVFSVSNEYNAEILFAVRYSKTLAGEGHVLNPVFEFAGLNLDPTLLAAYASTDQRRDLLNVTRIDANLAPVKKYFDTPFNNTSYGNDFPVLRYADVLLMYAEATNEVGFVANGDALTNLNLVRTRAQAPAYTATALATQQSFRTAVYLERRLEFPLEEQRWYDLLRTGTAAAAIRSLGGNYAQNFQDFRLLYPIPKSEIDKLNNPSFQQNPGY